MSLDFRSEGLARLGGLQVPELWSTSILCQSVLDSETTTKGKTMRETTRTPAEVQAEEQANALATLIRTALQASREAGYQTAKVIWERTNDLDVLLAAQHHATEQADRLTVEMWAAFYEVCSLLNPSPSAAVVDRIAQGVKDGA